MGSGGDRRQPLELNAGEGSLHHPASGQGQAGNQGTWRQLDALSQLAAEAEGGSDAEQRQGAGGGDRRGVQRHLRVNVALLVD